MSSIRLDIRDAKIHLGRYLKIVQKGNELIEFTFVVGQSLLIWRTHYFMIK